MIDRCTPPSRACPETYSAALYRHVGNMADSLGDLCISNLCKTRLPVYSIRTSFRPELVPERLERVLSRKGSDELPYVIATQLVDKLSEEGTLSARILSFLLSQSERRLGSLQLHLTQMTFDEFRRLPPISGLVDFDCSYVDHVTNALWEKFEPEPLVFALLRRDRFGQSCV